MIPGSQIRARMQRGGHICSVEGTWVGRTREPAGPDVDLVRKETTNQIASRFDFFLSLLFFVKLGTALSNVRYPAPAEECSAVSTPDVRPSPSRRVRRCVDLGRRTQPWPKSAALCRSQTYVQIFGF